jgi:hypothetical protein
VLLRASGRHGGEDYDLANILGEGLERSRIPQAGLLVDFADAFFDAGGRLAEARAAIVRAMGPAALADAAGVLAIFNAVVRIADATGIPLEAYKEELSRDLRGPLGIDGFPAAAAKGPG